MAVADNALATLRAGADDAGVVARSRYGTLQHLWNRFDPGISLMKFILLALAVVALLGLMRIGKGSPPSGISSAAAIGCQCASGLIRQSHIVKGWPSTRTAC